MPAARPKTTSNATRINLALQGGGAHGAFAWGVLDKLLEDGRLEIDSLSATSAGAMNAAVAAYGHLQGGRDGARSLLETFWTRISRVGQMTSPGLRTPLDDMMKLFGVRDPIAFRMFEATTHLFSPYQINPLNLNPLRDVLSNTVDFERLRRDGTINLHICATNVRSGDVRIFTRNEISVDAVLASACLPQLFHAVEIQGEHYWDGGYMGNPAIFPLIYGSETRDVLILHINPIKRTEVPTSPADIFNRVNELSFNSSLLRELRAIAFVTKLIDEDWVKDEHKDKLKRMRIHAIRADDHMAAHSVSSKFQTDWAFLTGLRDAGRAAAASWLSQNGDRVGHASSIDIHREYFA